MEVFVASLIFNFLIQKKYWKITKAKIMLNTVFYPEPTLIIETLYSSNEIRKTQNEHLNIIRQNLNCRLL